MTEFGAWERELSDNTDSATASAKEALAIARAEEARQLLIDRVEMLIAVVVAGSPTWDDIVGIMGIGEAACQLAKNAAREAGYCLLPRYPGKYDDDYRGGTPVYYVAETHDRDSAKYL